MGVGRTKSGIDYAQGNVAGGGWGWRGPILGPVADGWEEGRSPKTSLLQSPKTWRWGEGHGCAPGGCGFAGLLAHLSGPPRSPMRKPRLTGSTDRARWGCTALPLCRRPGPAHEGTSRSLRGGAPCAGSSFAAGVCPTPLLGSRLHTPTTHRGSPPLSQPPHLCPRSVSGDMSLPTFCATLW